MTPPAPISVEASYAFCARVSRREARNFYWSFVSLPRPRRLAMCALYAFFRRSDDLADDETPSPLAEKIEALDAWRRELDDALAGRFASEGWPGLPALADTVARYEVRPADLHAVLDGMAMDLNPVRFETFDNLYPYLYNVASAVGLCCIRVWGYRSDGGIAEELAESCGVALQLTNILRDVREDALRGRIYFPEADLRRFGIEAQELVEARTVDDRLRALFAFEADRARSAYETSAGLIEYVDPVGRPVLRTMVGIYRELLHEIERRRYDVLSARVSVTPARKLGILIGSLLKRERSSMASVPVIAPLGAAPSARTERAPGP